MVTCAALPLIFGTSVAALAPDPSVLAVTDDALLLGDAYLAAGVVSKGSSEQIMHESALVPHVELELMILSKVPVPYRVPVPYKVGVPYMVPVAI